MENYQNFGEVITVINSHPYKFNIGFYSHKPGPEEQHIDEYYVYQFNDIIADKPQPVINFKVRIEKDLGSGFFQGNTNKMHQTCIFFGLREIRTNPKETCFDFFLTNVQEINNIKNSTGEELERGLLEFSFLVNKEHPSWEISTEEYGFNIKASLDDIEERADSLYEQMLLTRNRMPSVPKRFSKGYRGINKYRIDQNKRDEITKLISRISYSEHDFDIDSNNMASLLTGGESEILELKGSLELDVERYLLGDTQRVLKRELNREILRTIVGFLNSSQKSPRHLLIGILERNKFNEIKQYKNITENFILFGIKREYGKSGWDGYESKIRDLIKSRISDVAFQFLKISRITIDDTDICLIKTYWPTVPPSKWFYLDKTEFWVREGNRTRRLVGEAADDYKKNKPRG